jgi:outer membrane protein OmpU
MLVELAFSQNANTRNYQMKNILLSSAAVFAFAGAAAADGHLGVTFSGVASLGYNDTDVDDTFVDDDNVGFYADLEITIGLAAELDNGLMAAASIDLEDLAAGQDSGENGADTMIDFELSLTSEMAGLYYGDTQFAAERMWVSAGDMESDGFSEADGEEALRGEVTYGNVTAQLSYVLANNAGTRNAVEELNQLSLGVSGDFGNFNVVAAYQAESDEAAGFYGSGLLTDGDNGDFNFNEVFGLSVGTTFSGADIRVAYASDETAGEDSLGVQVAYPFGPVTATVYYVSESEALGDNYGLTLAYENGPIAATFDYDNDQGTDKYGIEGSYNVGNGIMVYAGYLFFDGLVEEDAFYVAGTYDLGSGAEFLLSYADADDDEYGDEVGANDYQEGITAELSLAF